MTPIQIDNQNAVAAHWGCCRRWSAAVLLALIFCVISAHTGRAAPAPIPRQQIGETGLSAAYYLVPVESTTVTLATHTAEFVVQTDPGTGRLTAAAAAVYRLDNEAAEARTLMVRVRAFGRSGVLGAPTLTADGVPLTLQPGEDDSLTTQLTVPADGRITLSLRYLLTFPDTALLTLAYAVEQLASWPGNTSVAVAMEFPPAVASQSLVVIAPTDWRYGNPTVAENSRIRWLYDGPLPAEALTVRFVAPAVWQTLTGAQQLLAQPGGAAQLGRRYSDLYEDARRLGDQALADRFYSQAVAAYVAGLEQAGGTSAERGALHAALAQLYRSRVAGADGPALRYVDLMVQEAAAARAALPADDARAGELLRWQVEGLTLLAQQARREASWTQALALLDQLAALPPGAVDPEQLADLRETLTLQHALSLLEQGRRDAAVALAGPDIVDAALLPDPADMSLFAGWQVTVTVQPEQLAVQALAVPAAGQEEAAATAVADVVNRWQATELQGLATRWDRLPGGLLLQAELPVDTPMGELADVLPAHPNWAILQNIWRQSAPQVARNSGLLREEVAMAQLLDLRTAGDQWDAMAVNLERRAQQLDDAAAAANRGDAAAVEGALRDRMMAVNYRGAARVWQELEQSSWVLLRMSVPGGLQTNTRTWLTDVASPGQTYEFRVEFVRFSRVLMAIGGLVLVLLLFSALLWRLL